MRALWSEANQLDSLHSLQHCSLRLRGITHADRHHLPIIRVAHSFSTLVIHCSLCSDRITHTQTIVICPSLALLAHSGISAHTLLTLLTQNHRRRQASSAHRSGCCSFRALRRHCSLRSYRISAHGLALFALQEHHLVRHQGTTWWHGSIDLPRPSPKYQPNQTTNS